MISLFPRRALYSLTKRLPVVNDRTGVARSEGSAAGRFTRLTPPMSQLVSQVKTAPAHGPLYQPSYLSELKRHPLFQAKRASAIASVTSGENGRAPRIIADDRSAMTSEATHHAQEPDRNGNGAVLMPHPQSALDSIQQPFRTWSAEAAHRPERTTHIRQLVSDMANICNAAHDNARALSTARLSLDLSAAFGGMLFTPEDTRIWRDDIAEVARSATLFAENHQQLLGFITSEKAADRNEELPASIISFTKAHEFAPSLLITDTFLDKGDSNAIIQFIRAMGRSVHRQDALLFPVANNQDAITLSMRPSGTRRELEAYHRAALSVNRQLIRGDADAEIDRAAVKVGSEFPSTLIASSSAPTAAALKAFHRDADWTQKVTKSNCDSLVQYVLRLAIPDAGIIHPMRR